MPASIRKFEIFYLVAWVVSLIATFLSWDSQIIAQARLGRQFGLSGYSAITTLALLLPLVLWYLAARRRSNIARRTIIAVFALQAIGVLYALGMASLAPGLIGALGVLILVLRAISVRFLFAAEAREWYGVRRSKVHTAVKEQAVDL